MVFLVAGGVVAATKKGTTSEGSVGGWAVGLETGCGFFRLDVCYLDI